MVKIIFLDTETTGLDAAIHGMHQLAGTIVIADEVVDRFDYKINPFEGCVIDKEALKISNTSTLDFLKYNEEWQVRFMLSELLDKYKDYENKQDKYFLATWAQDPAFDVRFLKAFVKRNPLLSGEYDSYFWSNFIDVKSLATQYLLKERAKIESFSLAPVSKYLGIAVDESQLHKATYDAYLCRKVYEVVSDVKIRDKKKLIKVKR